MTYESVGRQFVVIAAGGGNEFGFGDAIIAFAPSSVGGQLARSFAFHVADVAVDASVAVAPCTLLHAGCA